MSDRLFVGCRACQRAVRVLSFCGSDGVHLDFAVQPDFSDVVPVLFLARHLRDCYANQTQREMFCLFSENDLEHRTYRQQQHRAYVRLAKRLAHAP